MQAAIFDLDGTLVDSMPYWRGHMKTYLKNKGAVAPDNLEELVNTAGSFSIILELVQQIDPSITRDAMIHDYHTLMAQSYLVDIEAKPFVYEYLDFLYKKKIPMAIATATPRELFMPMLERLGFVQFFEFFITVPEIGARKSEPDIYDYCANRFDLPRSSCVVFEDTIQAITTAKKAGYYTVGVADRVSAWTEDAIRSVSDKFIDSYSILLQNDIFIGLQPMQTDENKAKLGSSYYYIDLNVEWTQYRYSVKINQMDQTDRYNFATHNWSYSLEDIKERAFDVLAILTCKSEKEIAEIMLRSEA